MSKEGEVHIGGKKACVKWSLVHGLYLSEFSLGNLERGAGGFSILPLHSRLLPLKILTEKFIVLVDCSKSFRV